MIKTELVTFCLLLAACLLSEVDSQTAAQDSTSQKGQPTDGNNPQGGDAQFKVLVLPDSHILSEQCLLSNGFVQTDQDVCRVSYCVLRVEGLAWWLYVCPQCDEERTRDLMEHCAVDFRHAYRQDLQRRRENNDTGAFAWIVFMMLVFMMTCCCRAFRKQICCDCYDSSSTGRQTLDSMEMQSVGTAAAPVPAPPAAPPPTSPPRERKKKDESVVVLVYNPDDDVSVGITSEKGSSSK